MKLYIVLFSFIFIVDSNAQSISKQTIGHEILSLEYEIFQKDVSNELNQILDKIIEGIEVSEVDKVVNEEKRAMAYFKKISEILISNGYSFIGLYPNSLTQVLSGLDRDFDCDTGSFIYLSVADRLKLPLSMVEIEANGGDLFSDHNFVRWTTESGLEIDWDVNGEYRRSRTISNDLYGYSWTKNQLLGYVQLCPWNRMGKRN